MSLIAPSNLLALQSYTAPSKAPVRAGNDVFQPLGDSATPAKGRQVDHGDQGGRGGGDVTVKLSQDAVRHLEAGTFAITNASPPSGASAKSAAPASPQGTAQPQNDRPLAPGSLLDITI